jgi:hypothetical protein
MADALKARRSCGGQLDRLRFRLGAVHPFPAHSGGSECRLGGQHAKIDKFQAVSASLLTSEERLGF